MKIGIITWFRDENYGTKLQALALQRYLRLIGNEVYLVNFETSIDGLEINKKIYIGKKERLKNHIHVIEGTLLSEMKKVIYNKDLKIRSERFAGITNELCNISQFIKSEEAYVRECNNYDLLIFGSDQIWTPNGFHKYWYADYPDISTRKASYAPSLGVDFIPQNMQSDYIRCLSSFEYLSVRESIAGALIEKLINKKPSLVVDPTFLLSNNEWDQYLNINCVDEEYILCFLLRDNLNHYRAIKEFAKTKNKRLKIIPYRDLSFFINGEKHVGAGPKEFVNLIKYASYICTDSYHGMVFSMIYHKEFFIFERFAADDKWSQNSRIMQLLERYNLESRLVKNNSNRIENNHRIDYELVYESLNKDIIDSKKYLHRILER